jgi:hypothetical protein
MVMFKNYFIAIFLVVLSVISFKIRAMEGSPDSDELDLLSGRTARRRIARQVDPSFAAELRSRQKRLLLINQDPKPLTVSVIETNSQEARDAGISAVVGHYSVKLGSTHPTYKSDCSARQHMYVPVASCIVEVSVPHTGFKAATTLTEKVIERAHYLLVSSTMISAYRELRDKEKESACMQLEKTASQEQSMVGLFLGLPETDIAAADCPDEVLSVHELQKSEK